MISHLFRGTIDAKRVGYPRHLTAPIAKVTGGASSLVDNEPVVLIIRGTLLTHFQKRIRFTPEECLRQTARG